MKLRKLNKEGSIGLAIRREVLEPLGWEKGQDVTVSITDDNTKVILTNSTLRQEQGDNFLEERFNELIEQKSIPWSELKTIPKKKGCYIICHIGYPRVIYVGESKDMYDRLYNHHRTGNCSSFRRNLEDIKSSNRPKETAISQFLDECVVKCLPLDYGRKELEEYIIAKLNPQYNK